MPEFEVYKDESDEYRWRLTSGTDIIADSGEGYGSKSGARRAVENVQDDAGNADVTDN